MLINLSQQHRLSIVAACVMLTFACANPSDNENAEVGADANAGSQQTQSQTDKPNQPQAAETDERKLHTSEFEAMPEMITVTGTRQMVASESRARLAPITAIAADSFVSHSKQLTYAAPQVNSETYQNIDESSVKLTRLEPVSTFSIDVDTGSYSNARRMLTQGIMPPRNAVRIEEFLNYFDYQYAPPSDASQPFSVYTAISPAPWDKAKHVLRIGLKGYQPGSAITNYATGTSQVDKINSNLVFLLDVSGSMNQENKLPLLKRSLMMLTNELESQDKVSIVVYAGASGVVLKPTDGNNKQAINSALQALRAGGSTNGGAGIELAYQLAEQAFISGGVNRVVLATDGDFNVGMSSHDALIELIEQKREKGIALTTLGFGHGNYNDYLMEQLADAGNGNYAYIDTINEARKVLVDELQSTMQIIAKDVKIQVEFNPALVAEYRLIGYDNRALANEDFNNDKVDAGDIGAGHKVTALYEISLHDSASKFNDALRYANEDNSSKANMSQELAHVKLRYKQPEADISELIEHVVNKQDVRAFDLQPDDYKFALAVASFAQRIKQSKYTHNLDYDWIVDTAQQSKGQDDFGYRSEFIQLVRTSATL